ncbi:MAG: hypothetical protein LHW64_12000 [Candidatus Cloacimonetes bacterium]|nr:hypothetical protein [Candidatus Cloacimonadota bacterium]MDY0230805.1 hypothetical protein [Candidatus Cloacimonadaceae bacterium]
MAYQLPNIHSRVSDIADFIEIKSFFASTQAMSLNEMRASFAMPSDEISADGACSDDDVVMEKLEDALREIFERNVSCNGTYPFNIDINSLNYISTDYKADIYIFLLLATRLNMQVDKIQNEEDGTKLFEQLCAEIAKNYFGQHSKSIVFGTGQAGGFREKVNDLFTMINSKAVYKDPDGSTGRQKDAHLDVVTWIPFSDKKGGQLLAMGQCKTGTTWEGMLPELNPDDFFSNFATKQPYVKHPVRLFFVAEYFSNYKWEERSRAAGIIFDRCRIMEFLPESISASLLESINKWKNAALITIKASL